MGAKIINFSEAAVERKHQSELLRQNKIVAVRLMGDDPTSKMRIGDARVVACVVNQKIEELKRKKVTLDDIHAKMVENGANPSHLERLRVKSLDDRTVSTEKLVLKVERYISVLEALAALLGINPDSLIWEAFRNTSICSELNSREVTPHREFSFLIQQMAEYVVHSCQLQNYFDHLRSVVGAYNPAIGDFIVNGAKTFMNYPDGYEDSLEPWEAAPPFPAVDLFRTSRAALAGPLKVESEIFAPGALESSEVARLATQAPTSLKYSIEMDCELTIDTDVRLALGPTTGPNSIGPMFETRTHISILMGGLPIPITVPFSVSELEAGGTVAGRINGDWHRIGGISAEKWRALWGDFDTESERLLHLFDPQLGGLESYYVCWTAVNEESVERLMELCLNSMLFECSSNGIRPAPETFRFGRHAQQSIETALANGSIERSLLQSAKELCQKLDSHRRKLEGALDREADALLSIWQRGRE